MTCRSCWIFQFVLGCGLWLQLCSGQGLSVIGTKLIRPNQIYSVAFSNSLNRNVRLEVSLRGLDPGSVLKQRSTVVVSRRSGKFVSFQVGDIVDGDYSLSIRSIDQDFIFNEDVDLMYERKTLSVFIQTDKPIYKPGDTLHFRVVVVDADTRPVANIDTINIGLTDSDDNSIRQWPYARLWRGVFESAVLLAPSPLLGNWTLTVTAGDVTVEKQIEVREYVLPKFFVKVFPSEILLIERKEIIVSVESFYTFGSPVDGTALVRLFVDDNNFSESMPITGTSTVKFNLQKELEIEGESQNYRDVIVEVEVTETFTNRTMNITQSIPVFLYPYNISAVVTTPQFRPGVPYPLQIVVKDHYGKPVADGKNINVLVAYEGDGYSEDIALVETLSERGIATFVLQPPENSDRLGISVNYDSVDYGVIETFDGVQSQSNQYIRISLKPRSVVRVNKEIAIDVSCTEGMSHLSYIIISRGRLVTSGHELVRNRKKHTFRLKLTPPMAPKAKLIVSYTSKQFLIYDDLELDFDVFNNNFRFSLDKKEYRPGGDITIEAEAGSDSYVAFAAIDQNVLLLGRDGNDFSKSDVLHELARYGATEPNDFDPFHTMGLFLRTTAEVDFPSSRGQFNRFGGYFPAPSRRVQKAVHIRTEFPEAWLWRNFTMNTRQPVLSFEDTVPDTITSWTVTGFALSPTLGLGLMSEPQSFVVKQSFYIIANIPYSIKRGEVALIQVTVFNFLGNAVTVDVTLFNRHDEIEFVENSSTDNTRRRKAITVPSNSGKPTSFMIKAKKIGDVAIKVEAVCQRASDAVEHMLRVVPESHLYEENEARFIELVNHGTQNFDISLNIPKKVVPGSVKITFTVAGNLLGPAIKNLDSLIRLPTGCGEQNMMNFVPNVVVLDYLVETGTLAEDLKTKATNHLQSGYQNQLKYKCADGSFNVWGRTEDNGNTFLTAFVAKSFKIADKYITIDRLVVETAFQWLADIQKPDGQFAEVGTIFSKDLQGGLGNSNYSLTAYVLIAFLENEDISEKYRTTIDKTLTYLVNSFDLMTDVYDLALATYALALDKHAKTTAFMGKLVENSIFDKHSITRYWDRKPVGIEVAGYALLAYMQQGSYADATPVVRWLNEQRYGQGGYRGTQDTFVGLKALARFAAKMIASRNNYRVMLVNPHQNRNARLLTFDVNSESSMDVQENTLPHHIRSLGVKIEGIGNGMFQVTYQYNVDLEQAKPSFNLNVQLLNTTTHFVQHLEVCVNFIQRGSLRETNMALVEVYFPSGFNADGDAVTNRTPNNQIKKVEVLYEGSSVAVYYDKLVNTPSCFTVTAYRRLKVAMHRPAHVVVYDYYDQGTVSDIGKNKELEIRCRDLQNRCDRLEKDLTGAYAIIDDLEFELESIDYLENENERLQQEVRHLKSNHRFHDIVPNVYDKGVNRSSMDEADGDAVVSANKLLLPDETTEEVTIRCSSGDKKLRRDELNRKLETLHVRHSIRLPTTCE
ncbi:thioester-containing protein 1 allele R1-like isoform X2 [Topomyia yanbarensis]|uniref:thioester-containing protein 1 allele R1-like isoform X2 n=1 Tax=Topomyia yanbarensis TaxID=2498891 RepID=UPI00273C51D2|nr:thioester-containing protein 1 allele R1-like isoform X2 [Topomyia yanbarensis]